MFAIITGILAVLLLILLIVKCKLHPFVALIIASLALGLVNGLGPSDTVDAFSSGFGDQLSTTGIVIGLGAMIGGMLVASGGAETIANVIIGKSKAALIPVAIGLVALVIELPNLFEVTFVLMIPIVFSVARRLHKSALYVAIPMAAGMMAAHGLIPPGPATVIAGSAMGVDLGLVTIVGIVVAIPVFASGVWLFPKLMQKHYLTYAVNDGSEFGFEEAKRERTPGLGMSLASVLIAPVLMVLGTVGNAIIPDGSSAAVISDFIGNPIIALLLAALYSLIVLGLRGGMNFTKILSESKSSLKPVVNVLLIIGAGGGLKEMLSAIGLSDTIADYTSHWAIPVVLLAWVIAALFRVALGSGTVAVTAAAGIVAPMVASADPMHQALAALAVATGAMIFSHVSDGAFWLFQEYFGLTVPQTLKTWSFLVTVQSVVGLLGLLLINGVVALV
jgi:GntP family gluconate:H+ symporter